MDDLQGMDAPIKIRDKVTFQELKKVLARSCGVDTSDLEGVGLLAGIVIKHENGAVLRLLGPTTREGGEPGAQSAPAAQLCMTIPTGWWGILLQKTWHGSKSWQWLLKKGVIALSQVICPSGVRSS